MPKVSFLITYYNQEKYISQSLESVLNQKFDGEQEILIADDGSTDGTLEIINAYVKKYPEKIRLFNMIRESDKEYNSIERVSAARIKLFEEATGEYFCTLDGDDWYCSDTFVQKSIDVLEKNKNISVCAFLYQYWFSEENIKKVAYKKKEQKISASSYIKNMYIHAGACVYRNTNNAEIFKIVKNTGFFDDNDIVIYSLNFGNMYFIPEIVYSYRQSEGSIWNTTPEVLRNLINTWTYELERLYSPYKKELKYRYINAILGLYKNQSEISKFESGKNLLYFEYAKNKETEYMNDIISNSIECKNKMYSLKIFYSFSNNICLRAFRKFCRIIGF